jgi:hypothetical protein
LFLSDAIMAKKKHRPADTGGSAPNGQAGEKLSSKTEAVRRALDDLGPDATPVAIQEHVRKQHGVEISTKVISVYKAKLLKEGRKGRKGGPRPKVERTTREVSQRAGGHGEVSIRDLRAVKELSERVGPARLRELLDLLA